MKRRSILTLFSARGWLVGIGLMLAAGGLAGADAQSSAANSSTATTSPKFFKVCEGKAADGTPVPHGLCAVASCFVFNNLAYCQCDVATGDTDPLSKSGDSISLPFNFDNGQQDICTVNAAGVGNGYMASLSAFPPRSSCQLAILQLRPSTPARPLSRMEPTPNATVGSASPALAKGNRFQASTSRWGKTRSSALARSHRPPRRGWATRSLAPILARSRSSRTAGARPQTPIRARRSIPAPRLVQPPT